MLEVRALTKRFGGLIAVDGASLDVPEGAILTAADAPLPSGNEAAWLRATMVASLA